MSEIEIFISYAPEDEALKQELEKHLAVLRHKNLITVWHNRNISAGTEWEKTIHTHLDSSSIILLLISSDFLASHYCYGVEMKHALEKQRRGEARVIPVILRSVDWHINPLNTLQALPTNAKPVTLWADRDVAFRDIESGIRKAVEELYQKSSAKVPKSPDHSSTESLVETGVDQDEAIVRQAQQAFHGKYHVQIGDGKGTVIGDNAQVTQTFGEQ
jgi:hypothetical protein